MKSKIRVIITVVGLSVALIGCKSSIVKSAEKAINDIGTVSIESEELIIEAEKLYASLTENQKDDVTNYFTLLEAREEYNAIVAEIENKKIASEIDEKILGLEKKEFLKQSEIDEVESMYEALTDEQKAFVSNYSKMENIKKLNKYEEYALSAVKLLKNYLKNSDSMKLSSITIAECPSKASLAPYYVRINYSATNSFGGAKDDTATIDVNEKGESPWWEMTALFGDLEEGEFQLYANYLKCVEKEYEIDCDRILANM